MQHAENVRASIESLYTRKLCGVLTVSTWLRRDLADLTNTLTHTPYAVLKLCIHSHCVRIV